VYTAWCPELCDPLRTNHQVAVPLTCIDHVFYSQGWTLIGEPTVSKPMDPWGIGSEEPIACDSDHSIITVSLSST